MLVWERAEVQEVPPRRGRARRRDGGDRARVSPWAAAGRGVAAPCRAGRDRATGLRLERPAPRAGPGREDARGARAAQGRLPGCGAGAPGGRRGGSPRDHHRRARRDRACGDAAAGGLSEPAQLPRVPEVDLHLRERGDLPRHPRQPSPRGRGHREPRHHRLPPRHARRLLGDVPRGRGGPRRPAARPGRARVPREGHLGGAARPADLGHRPRDRGARLAARLRRGALVLRPRHRRDVPHLAPDPAPLRPVRAARSWRRG